MADWSLSTFPVESLGWTLRGVALSGGPTLSGPGQTAEISGGGWWAAALNDSDLYTTAHWQEWTGQLLDLFGGVQTIDVPVIAAAWGCTDVVATVTADAALRATTVELTATAGTIVRGAPFSIDHGGDVGVRLYQVRKDNGDGTFAILPPLRAAVAALDAVDADFAAPKCRMRLDDPNGQAWPVMQPDLSARVSIQFQEAF